MADFDNDEVHSIVEISQEEEQDTAATSTETSVRAGSTPSQSGTSSPTPKIPIDELLTHIGKDKANDAEIRRFYEAMVSKGKLVGLAVPGAPPVYRPHSEGMHSPDQPVHRTEADVAGPPPRQEGPPKLPGRCRPRRRLQW